MVNIELYSGSGEKERNLIMIKYMWYLSPFRTSDPPISKVSRGGRDLKGDTLFQLYGFYMV